MDRGIPTEKTLAQMRAEPRLVGMPLLRRGRLRDALKRILGLLRWLLLRLLSRLLLLLLLRGLLWSGRLRCALK